MSVSNQDVFRPGGLWRAGLPAMSSSPSHNIALPPVDIPRKTSRRSKRSGGLYNVIQLNNSVKTLVDQYENSVEQQDTYTHIGEKATSSSSSSVKLNTSVEHAKIDDLKRIVAKPPVSGTIKKKIQNIEAMNRAAAEEREGQNKGECKGLSSNLVFQSPQRLKLRPAPETSTSLNEEKPRDAAHKPVRVFLVTRAIFI